MSRRFTDALMIQEGACNPSGIAHSIVKACQEARDEGLGTKEDPAIKLMVHQLAFICGIINGAEEFHLGTYAEAMAACRAADDADAEKLRIALKETESTT